MCGGGGPGGQQNYIVEAQASVYPFGEYNRLL
jgi:hypothetical protein